MYISDALDNDDIHHAALLFENVSIPVYHSRNWENMQLRNTEKRANCGALVLSVCQ